MVQKFRCFTITSYERAGEFNGEETYSVTLESSNTITYECVIMTIKLNMVGK